MREEFYVETAEGTTIVSANVVNQISEYLIAKVETEEELSELVITQMHEQAARKEAFKRAYEEVPIPMGSISLEARREIQIRRNELMELYFYEYLEKMQ